MDENNLDKGLVSFLWMVGGNKSLALDRKVIWMAWWFG